MKKYILFAFTVLCSFYAKAQQEVKAVTPEVATLIKYIKNPVSYDRGLVDISIPLYEITAGDITVPIVLNYHHGGLKPRDLSLWLGQGWSLTAAPSVGRIINGLADKKGVYTSPDDRSITRDATYYDLLNRYVRYSEEPDEYFYNLPGSNSGSFFFKAVSGEFKPVTFPFEPVRINHPSENLFEITNDKGVTYRFGHTERGGAIEYSYVDNIYGQVRPDYPNEGVVAWKCADIISSSKKDTVRFGYYEAEKDIKAATGHSIVLEDNFVSSHSWVRDWVKGGAGFRNPCAGIDDLSVPNLISTGYDRYGISFQTKQKLFPVMNPDYVLQPASVWEFSKFINCNTTLPYTGLGYSISAVRRLKSIEFNGGKVTFDQQLRQNTHPAVNGNAYHYSYLTNITVSNKAGKIIRTIRLINKFVSAGGSQRIKGHRSDYPVLTGVEIRDGNSNVVENYVLEYNGDPYVDYTPSIDHWGYYTKSENRHDIYNYNDIHLTQRTPVKSINPGTATYDTFYIPVGGVNRERPTSIDGTLKAIVHPTGYRTELIYEPNKYEKLERDSENPWDIYAPLRSKIVSAGGLRIKEIRQTDPLTGKVLIRKFKYGRTNREDGFVGDPNEESGVGIIKRQINIEDYASRQKRKFTNNNAYQDGTTDLTTFHNNPFGNITHAGAAIVYDRVTEYMETTVNGELINNGKTVYEYDYQRKFTDNSTWYASFLYPGTNVYQDDKSDWMYGKLLSRKQYKWIGQNNYVPVMQTDYTYHTFYKEEVPTARVYQSKVIDGASSSSASNYQEYLWSLQYIRNNLRSGAVRLKTETSTEYAPQGVTTTNREYAYDNLTHLYPTTVKETNSDGTVTTRSMKYPLDNSTITDANHTAAKAEMVNRWIVSPVLEDKATTPHGTQTTVWAYKKFSTAYTNNLPLLHRTISQRGAGAQEERYVCHNYDAYGNPIYITRDGTGPVVYIWGYNGRYLIAEIIGATYAEVRNALGVDMESFSASASPDISRIEALRSVASLKNAQISTYSYTPLVGMIKATDARGLSTYYIYDAFGRLKEAYFIENGVKKMLKSYDYHYYNQ